MPGNKIAGPDFSGVLAEVVKKASNSIHQRESVCAFARFQFLHSRLMTYN